MAEVAKSRRRSGRHGIIPRPQTDQSPLPPSFNQPILGAAALACESHGIELPPAFQKQAGNPWLPHDDRVLLSEFEAVIDIRDIARTLGRTHRALAARLVRLGRIQNREAAYRTTR